MEFCQHFFAELKLFRLILINFELIPGSCKTISCPNGESCIEDQNFNGHCVNCAAIKCNKMFSKNVNQMMICGTDGVTYESSCEAVKQSCRLGIAIQKAYDGPCNGECQQLASKYQNFNIQPTNQQFQFQTLKTHSIISDAFSCAFK